MTRKSNPKTPKEKIDQDMKNILPLTHMHRGYMIVLRLYIPYIKNKMHKDKLIKDTTKEASRKRT